jgi:HlyD family secretion protein
MSEELNNIELRSDEVQEILGHIPSRIIRYGVTVILCVVVLLFGGSFFFKYPDILTAPVEVVSQNAPAVLVAQTSGNLSHLFVADSQQVITNQVLGVIKNPADFQHLQWLKQKLNDSRSNLYDTIWMQQFTDTLQAGTVQAQYALFLNGVANYFQFLKLDIYGKKIHALYLKKQELEKYIGISEKQVVFKQQEYELASNKFERDSILYLKDVFSLAEYEEAHKVFIQQGMALENIRSAAVNARMEMQDLNQQIADYQLESQNQKQQLENVLQQHWQNLQSQIDAWFDLYVLLAPIDGIVAFNNIWTANQPIASGQEIFTIVPQAKTQIIGRVSLPVQGAGKVKVGQLVNLKFESFPYQEFGMIQAQVSNISLVPAEQNYMVEIQLPDTLWTNYGYLLPFSQKMQGIAEIITDDLPLIVRLFNPLKAVFKSRWSMERIQRQDQNKNKASGLNTSILLHNKTQQESAETKAIADSISIQQKLYHIVVASFLDVDKAQKTKRIFDEKGYATELLQADNRWRLSVCQTSNKKEALQLLDSIRQKENNPDIWILVLNPARVQNPL